MRIWYACNLYKPLRVVQNWLMCVVNPWLAQALKFGEQGASSWGNAHCLLMMCTKSAKHPKPSCANRPPSLLVGLSSSQRCYLWCDKGDWWQCLNEFCDELFGLAIDLIKKICQVLHIFEKILNITRCNRLQARFDILPQLYDWGFLFLCIYKFVIV